MAKVVLHGWVGVIFVIIGVLALITTWFTVVSVPIAVLFIALGLFAIFRKNTKWLP